jgi:hypothetical protein
MTGEKQGKKKTGAGMVLVLLLVLATALVLYVKERPSGPGEVPPAVIAPASAIPVKKGFSRLEIRNVTRSGARVRIEGATDLPDGAIVNVDFNTARAPEDGGNAVSVNAVVKGGTFAVVVDLPHTPGFARGPYRADVLFSPRMQRKDVLGIVGDDGERLEGGMVRETFGFKVLEVTKQVELAPVNR